MPFTPNPSQPDITVARNYLVQSNVKTKDPALFQSIDNLIRWLQNYQQSVQITINSSGADISGLVAIITQLLTGTFLTSTDQTSFLANSRELIAGSGITFDDSTPGERTIEASGSAGDTATYLTATDESASLPNSRELLAGIGIAFDDSVANERTISRLAADAETITLTGTNHDVDFNNALMLRCNNASDLTITGFLAGVAGQLLYVVSVGAGNVFLANQTGSSADNRLINRVSSSNTPLAAGKGAALYQYDATTQRWRLIFHEQGAAIIQTFSAGEYTANGSMTWTVAVGDVVADTYYLRGNQLFINLVLSTTTVGGTPNTELIKTIPGGFSTSVFEQGVIWLISGGTQQAGRYFTTGGTTISHSLMNGGNWTAGTDNVYLSWSNFITVT